eukprot:scaffold5362_cov100-Isochrysis_galbana.AAC.9
MGRAGMAMGGRLYCDEGVEGRGEVRRWGAGDAQPLGGRHRGPRPRAPTCILLQRRVSPIWFWPSAVAAPTLASAPAPAPCPMLMAASAAPERPDTEFVGPTPAAESAAAMAGLPPMAAMLAPCMPSIPAVAFGTVDDVTTAEMDWGMMTRSRPGGGAW